MREQPPIIRSYDADVALDLFCPSHVTLSSFFVYLVVDSYARCEISGLSVDFLGLRLFLVTRKPQKLRVQTRALKVLARDRPWDTQVS